MGEEAATAVATKYQEFYGDSATKPPASLLPPAVPTTTDSRCSALVQNNLDTPSAADLRCSTNGDKSERQPAVERSAASVAASKLINSWGEAAGKSVVAKLIQSCVESYPAASSSTSSNHVLINQELLPPQHTQGAKWSDQSAELIAKYTASRSIGAASLASPVDAIGRSAAERAGA